MSDVRVDVIAIGSMAQNAYWNEKTPVRKEYATTVLVRSEAMALVVDPGWPAEVVRSALYYRAGLAPEAVTHVLLTHFDPSHYAGIGLFPKAVGWMYDEEIRYAEAELAADGPGRPVLARLRAVPDKLAAGVDLFPTFGHTPGHASLLIYTTMHSMVVAGDAVLTQNHFERGDLGEAPWNLRKAKESFQDVMEIADVIVPGHDNLFIGRTGGGWL